MGICFVGKRKFQEFIDEYIEPKTGNFISVENNQIVGQHKGNYFNNLTAFCSSKMFIYRSL